MDDMTVFQILASKFQYDFVRDAILVGVLIALCASLLGVTLVLKRFSFIGDGLSHVAFGAMTVAAVVGLKSNDMLLILPVTIIAALLLLAAGRNRKIMGDASLAMISVSALGIGYLLMNRFSKSANVSGDVCTTLFGSTSILNLEDYAIWLCIFMSVIVVGVFILFYNKIFAVTFDPDFATATGTNANAYNIMIAVITAVIIVMAMKLVGSLLISALVVFPALSAMRLFRSFKGVIVFSGCLGVFCSALGILISVVIGSPIGSTIVVVQLLAFIVCYMIGFFTKSKG